MSDDAPSRAVLEAELHRLLDSPVFAGSERLRRFVRYTVEATLEGRADRIKEYVVGTEVFDRGEDYDPRIDPIVRVEAGRLRAKLDEYYAGAGRGDPIRIRLPKGGYVPTFEAMPPGQTGSGTEHQQRPARLAVIAATVLVTMAVTLGAIWWRNHDSLPRAVAGATASPPVTLAVLPLESYKSEGEGTALADAVTEALITELAKLDGLQVRSRTTVMRYRGTSGPMAAIARELDVGAVVEGGLIRAGDRLHLKIRLVDAERDVKLWAASYSSSVGEIVPLQRQVAAEIQKALAERG